MRNIGGRLLAVAALALIPASLALIGCGEEGNATHNAGQDCTNCHGYSYAGTVYTSATGGTGLSNAVVTITDSTGTFEMITNSAGNFFTFSGNPGGGYTASVKGATTTMAMVASQTSGACNNSSCHGSSSAQGRIYTN